MKRELVKTITAKGNRELVCYINRVDDSYYEVVYNRKSEYLTNNLNTAILVAKIIIVYHQNLNKCNELLYKTNIPKEKRWDNVLELLRKEYVKSPIDSKISLKIYETLDSNYQGLSDVKTKNDMDKLSIVATITAKDKLMEAISETTSSIEPNTAYKTIIDILNSEIHI